MLPVAKCAGSTPLPLLFLLLPSCCRPPGLVGALAGWRQSAAGAPVARGQPAAGPVPALCMVLCPFGYVSTCGAEATMAGGEQHTHGFVTQPTACILAVSAARRQGPTFGTAAISLDRCSLISLNTFSRACTLACTSMQTTRGRQGVIIQGGTAGRAAGVAGSSETKSTPICPHSNQLLITHLQALQVCHKKALGMVCSSAAAFESASSSGAAAQHTMIGRSAAPKCRIVPSILKHIICCNSVIRWLNACARS